MKPKMKYHHVNLTERLLIQRHYEDARPLAVIVEMLGRDRRTISREIERHSIYGRYDAIVADEMYQLARSNASSVAWKVSSWILELIPILMKIDRLSPKQIYHWCLQQSVQRYIMAPVIIV